MKILLLTCTIIISLSYIPLVIALYISQVLGLIQANNLINILITATIILLLSAITNLITNTLTGDV